MKSLLSLACGLLSVSMALAQSSSTQVTRITTVIGDKVVLQNETVGKVTDIVLSDGGCVEYVVVSYNDQFVAIPWQVVRVDTTQSVVTIQNTQVTMANLRQLAFAGNSWPNFTDSKWTQRMQSVWGAQAFRSGSGQSNTGSSGAAARTGSSSSSNDRSSTSIQSGSSTNRSSNAQSGSNNSNSNQAGSTNPSGSSSNRSSNSQSGPSQGNAQGQGSRTSKYPDAPDISKLKPYNPSGQSGGSTPAPSNPGSGNRNPQPSASGTTPGSTNPSTPARRDPNSPEK